MVSAFIFALVGVVTAGIIVLIATWRRTYASAKSAGLPVLLFPFHLNDVWLIALIYLLTRPLLARFPSNWKVLHHPLFHFTNVWRAGYKPFDEVGNDTFLVATPRGNMLFSCDNEIIRQLDAQGSEPLFPEEALRKQEIYGPSVGSVEGQEWKKHRKIIMAGFTPSLNAAVWSETMRQTQKLIRRWSEEGNYVPAMTDWTTRLALHVLSAVSFGRPLSWDDVEKQHSDLGAGHKMRYEDALQSLLDRLPLMGVIPRAILARLPIKAAREALRAYTEWTGYMKELRREAVSQTHALSSKKNRTILESIVLAGEVDEQHDKEARLSEDKVFANMFFLFIAGTDSPGNTLAFMLNLLALYPEWQLKIQEQLDQLSAHRSYSEWSVEQEFQRLYKGPLGAVINETQRLYTVVAFLPRRTADPTTVTDSEGNARVVPKDTICLLDFAAAFRNPKYWPPSKEQVGRRAALHESPALDFDPARWLNMKERGVAADDEEDTASPFFPFGQGPRVCPAKVFARVEMTAMVATLLTDHSLELRVDEVDLEKCGGDEHLAREQTRDRALRAMVDNVIPAVSLTLSEGVPLCIVRRQR